MPPPLKQCKECGAGVSKSAPACPQCGAIRKKKGGCLGSMVAILLLIIFVPMFARFLGNDTGSTRANGPTAPTVPAEQYIPGIAGVDVYGNLEERGFSVERERSKTSVSWVCGKSNELASYRVDVKARSPSRVILVIGTLLYSGENQADPFAKPFFGYLSTLPYTGSSPEEARKWVEENIGNIGAKTVLGDVEFTISGDGKTRILQLRHKGASPPSPAPKRSATPPAPRPAPKPVNWRYSHSEYAMGKGRIHHASTLSTNAVNFDFPYSGLQRGTLFLRTHPKNGKDLILSIERGQFLVRSYEDSRALVRFDDGDPISYKVVGAEDHSTTTVFFRDYHGFAERMLKAKRVRISVPVYKEGSPVFEFDVRGFDTAAYLDEK